MKTRLALRLSVVVLGLFLASNQLPGADPTAPFQLSASDSAHWYRGNLHTHSLWSDGDDYLESIAKWYTDHDYHFLSFTDHNVLADRERWSTISENKGGEKAFAKLQQNFPDWIETREEEGKQQVRLRTFEEVSKRFNRTGEFLLIQGEEISDKFEKLPIHLNGTNVAERLTPRAGDSVLEVIQNNVNALQIQRQQTGQAMMIHLNHPNFGYAITADDLARVVGENFFEVYNGHPGVHNAGDDSHPSTERIWDLVLTQRLAELDLPLMYGLATDDGHNYHNIPSRGSEPGRGWVMVLAENLTAESLINSLEQGRFYSSSGVELAEVKHNKTSYTVRIEPKPMTRYTIEFIGTRHNSTPEDLGIVLETFYGNSATYEYQGDELYVRARITASTPHPNPSELHDHEMAWTQPVVVKGK